MGIIKNNEKAPHETCRIYTIKIYRQIKENSLKIQSLLHSTVFKTCWKIIDNDYGYGKNEKLPKNKTYLILKKQTNKAWELPKNESCIFKALSTSKQII